VINDGENIRTDDDFDLKEFLEELNDKKESEGDRENGRESNAEGKEIFTNEFLEYNIEEERVYMEIQANKK